MRATRLRLGEGETVIQITSAKLAGVEDQIVGGPDTVVVRASTAAEHNRLIRMLGFRSDEGAWFEVGMEEVAMLLAELRFPAQQIRVKTEEGGNFQ